MINNSEITYIIEQCNMNEFQTINDNILLEDQRLNFK